MDLQFPLFMRFPRQEYWSGLSFPSAGDLPNPRIKPASPAELQANSLLLNPRISPIVTVANFVIPCSNSQGIYSHQPDWQAGVGGGKG